MVDKTGTLTVGKPKLVAVLPEAGHDEAEVLRLAASLEQRSDPPLAGGIGTGLKMLFACPRTFACAEPIPATCGVLWANVTGVGTPNSRGRGSTAQDRTTLVSGQAGNTLVFCSS